MELFVSLLGLFMDACCCAIFLRKFEKQLSGYIYLFVIAFVLYAVYRLHFGYSFSIFVGKDILVILMEILLVFLACRAFFSMKWKSALVAALIFAISIQVGRKLYFHVAEPLILNHFTLHSLQKQLINTALKMLCILPVLPEPKELREENIHSLELFLLLFALFNCFSIAAINVQTNGQINLVDINFICYISAFICAYIVKHSLAGNYRMLEMERIREDMRVQYEIWNQKKENDEAIKRMYHDLKHQIQALEMKGNTEELADALKSRLEERRLRIYTENPVLNVIFNEKEKTAEKDEIRFEMESSFGDFTFIEDLDLCSIFSNALDNALEAAKQCQKGERWIKLRYNEKEAFIAFSIQNSYMDIIMKDGKPITNKADSGYHGIGLKSIEVALRKYNGNCRIDAQDHIFTLSAWIPKP